MRHKTSSYLPEETMRSTLPGHLALRVSDFVHPREVLTDEDLDPIEKRQILAAWASDASSVESHPVFRWLAGTPGPVALEHVLAALRALDAQTEQHSTVIAAMAGQAQSQRARS